MGAEAVHERVKSQTASAAVLTAVRLSHSLSCTPYAIPFLSIFAVHSESQLMSGEDERREGGMNGGRKTGQTRGVNGNNNKKRMTKTKKKSWMRRQLFVQQKVNVTQSAVHNSLSLCSLLTMKCCCVRVCVYVCAHLFSSSFYPVSLLLAIKRQIVQPIPCFRQKQQKAERLCEMPLLGSSLKTGKTAGDSLFV